jgi:hypothetical protein
VLRRTATATGTLQKAAKREAVPPDPTQPAASQHIRYLHSMQVNVSINVTPRLICSMLSETVLVQALTCTLP